MRGRENESDSNRVREKEGSSDRKVEKRRDVAIER